MNFIWDNIFLIGVSLYCIGALLWPLIRRGARITHLQATQMINKGKVAIIDIRDQVDFQAGHVLNAVHVPFDSLEERLPKLEKFKSQPVIVICDSGKRSRVASESLKKAGFNEVYSLNGGMKAWKASGMPITM